MPPDSKIRKTNLDSGSERVPFERAHRILESERDLNLCLDGARWPRKESAPRGWEAQEDTLYRFLDLSPAIDNPEVLLIENIIRFPTARLVTPYMYRTPGSLPDEQVSGTFHSCRLIRRANSDSKRTSAIYVLLHGWNEITSLSLYYRLAIELLKQDPDAVCVIRPFRRHLTRDRFGSPFTTAPLDHYLNYPAELFSDFLAYSVETQWFLRAISPSGVIPTGYEELSGTRRLRLTPVQISNEVVRDWLALSQAAKRSSTSQTALPLAEPISPLGARRSIKYLRSVLGLSDTKGEAHTNASGADIPVHMVGYSLGGYLAQTSLFSWPGLVTTSTVLTSGGFAPDSSWSSMHEDKWRALLASLAEDLETAFMSGIFEATQNDDRIAGLDAATYRMLRTLFREVFSTAPGDESLRRISLFISRLLFVVTTEDPIVRSNSPISTVPAGVNMIELTQLGHFLSGPAQSPHQAAQRDFWLPEVARVIASFSHEAAKVRRLDLLVNTRQEFVAAKPRSTGGPSRTKKLPRPGSDGTLAQDDLEVAIDVLLDRAANGEGFLFVCGNAVPPEFLYGPVVTTEMGLRYAPSDSVIAYGNSIQRRRELIRNSGANIVLTVARQSPRVLNEMPLVGRADQRSERTDDTSDGATIDGKGLDREDQLREMARLHASDPKAYTRILVFDPGEKSAELDAHEPELSEAARRFLRIERDGELWITTLPEAWIWVTHAALNLGRRAGNDRATAAFARELGPKALDRSYESFGSSAERLEDLFETEQLAVLRFANVSQSYRRHGFISEERSGGRYVIGHAALGIASSRGLGSASLQTQ